jgi:hypothetical protein
MAGQPRDLNHRGPRSSGGARAAAVAAAGIFAFATPVWGLIPAAAVAAAAPGERGSAGAWAAASTALGVAWGETVLPTMWPNGGAFMHAPIFRCAVALAFGLLAWFDERR